MTDAMLEESLHGFDSNGNESFNSCMAQKAPKDRCFSTTESLDARVASAVGEHNDGLVVFHASVVAKLGFSLGEHGESGLKATETRLVYERKRKRRPAVKSVRSHAEHCTQAQLVARGSAPLPAGRYGTGCAVAIINGCGGSAAGAAAAAVVRPCPPCSEVGHRSAKNTVHKNYTPRVPRAAAASVAPSPADEG
jgi:hypothetical protein